MGDENKHGDWEDLRDRRKVAICVALVILLATGMSSTQAMGEAASSQIGHAHIGSYDLYVPHDYVRFPRTGATHGSSGALLAYYPGAAPVPGDLQSPKDGERWLQVVRIEFSDLAMFRSPTLIHPGYPVEALPLQIKLFHADKVLGEQYGLSHRTQLDAASNLDDLWIEQNKDQFVSFIRCQKKYAETVVPQCQHRFHDERFAYTVSYDARLLPHWQTIRSNAQALMGSFQSEETARAFLIDQTSNTKSGNESEKP